MKYCFELSTKGEEEPIVYLYLKKLMREIGREKQYQTFRRDLLKNKTIKLGDITIKRAIFIAGTRTKT